MNKLQTLASTLTLAILPTLPAQGGDERRLVEALNQFAADLYGELSTADAQLCSPASISFALLMVLPGARGDTADEIAAMLHLPADLRGERLTTATSDLLSKTAGVGGSNEDPKVHLQLANDFWGQTGHEFVPEYLELVKHRFWSGAHEVDFKSDCERARNAINERIAEATNQRIRELIPAGLVTPDTRTVISNAIWYRGKWVHEFYRPKKLAKFHVSAKRTVDASMMHVTKDFYYAESETWQAVEFPMQDRAIAFEVVLPREGRPLAEAESALLRGEYRAQRETARVQASMPTFRVRSAHLLRTPLNALGMRSAFVDGRADFTGIDANEPLNIDDVVHGAWILVDENGVEAAAATALVLKAGAAIREEPKVFRADRPFAFGLRDRRTGLLLFVGRVIDPTSGT